MSFPNQKIQIPPNAGKLKVGNPNAIRFLDHESDFGLPPGWFGDPTHGEVQLVMKNSPGGRATLSYGTWVRASGPRTQRCDGWADTEALAVWGRWETPGPPEDVALGREKVLVQQLTPSQRQAHLEVGIVSKPLM